MERIYEATQEDIDRLILEEWLRNHPNSPFNNPKDGIMI